MGPFSLSIHKDENRDETYNLVLKYLVAVGIPLVILFASVSYFLILILASGKYEISSTVVLPLVLSIFFQTLCGIFEIRLMTSLSRKGDLISNELYIPTLSVFLKVWDFKKKFM